MMAIKTQGPVAARWMLVATELDARNLEQKMEIDRLQSENARLQAIVNAMAGKWNLGAKVRKKRGSSWRGTVCGYYSTPHTPIGYCVDSAFEPGSVQVWPEVALEDWDGE